MSALTKEAVHIILTQFFPAKHDDFQSDYAEELKELNDFGIRTEQQLLKLLQKRVNEVMAIDRSPMEERDIRMHSDADGEAFVANRLREGFWFSYPALLRISLELEFGKAYEKYANLRDGFSKPAATPPSNTAAPRSSSKMKE